MGMMKSEMEDRKFNKNLFLKKINKSLKKVIVYPLNLKHFIALMVRLNWIEGRAISSNLNKLWKKLESTPFALPIMAVVWQGFWNSDHVVFKSSVHSLAFPCSVAVWQSS